MIGLGRSSGFPPFELPSHPVINDGTVDVVVQKFPNCYRDRVYSYGDSTGIAPVSLLIIRQWRTNRNRGKCITFCWGVAQSFTHSCYSTRATLLKNPSQQMIIRAKNRGWWLHNIHLAPIYTLPLTLYKV